MKPQLEHDSYGRCVYPVRTYIIEEEKALRVDLPTLEALAAENNAPHFVIRDSEALKERVWSLHFTNIPGTGLVIAYQPPSRIEEAAATNLEEVRTFDTIPPCNLPSPGVRAATSSEAAGVSA